MLLRILKNIIVLLKSELIIIIIFFFYFDKFKSESIIEWQI